MWYYVLVGVLLAEHIGRKFDIPRPSRLLRTVLNAVQPTVEWLAVCWADAMCFLALVNLIWVDIMAIARPLVGFVYLPVAFCNAVDKRIKAVRRPITYLWGSLLVVLLVCAHFVYTQQTLLLAADAMLVLLATYNCVRFTVKQES